MKGSTEPMVQSLECLNMTADAAQGSEVSVGCLMNHVGFDFAARGPDMLPVVPDLNNLR